MDKKSNTPGTVKPFPDIPQRTFDLLPRFVEKYGKKKAMFASKVDGNWKKYISRDFVKMTDTISQGLIVSIIHLFLIATLQLSKSFSINQDFRQANCPNRCL